MKKALVVGSGAGGAAIACQLQKSFQVTVLEAGKEFKPFPFNLNNLAMLRKTGMFFDPREIQLLFPAMRVAKTADKMVMVRGRCLGGTTTLSAGNALRQDAGLQKLGIDLGEEFAQLEEEIPITREHQDKWRPSTRQFFTICQEMGLDPQPLAKFGDYPRCTGCGRCVLGCSFGVKWDSRQLIAAAQSMGAQVVTGCPVTEVILEGGNAIGVKTPRGRYVADVVVLAAGGFSTPVILQNSGIACANKLFVDPVLCVAARQPGSRQNQELSMPFAVQRESYIVSPYFDHLSFFFHRDWRFPARDILSLMIKLADENLGGVAGRDIQKTLTQTDIERLQDGARLCTEIWRRYGVPQEDLFLGTINAGHPGGMLPLTPREATTLHHPDLPDNLYVADASLFPESMGNPPILTIMALAMRVGKVIAAKFG